MMMTAMETEAPPTGPEPKPAAPGDLQLVGQLVNTYDVTDNTDEIASVASLREWALERGLLRPAEAEALTAKDVARVARFREALRGLLRVNHGDDFDPEAAAVLAAEAERPVLRVCIDDDGIPCLTPAGEGVDRLVARLLAGIAHAEAEGTWRRLKVCADDTCAVAFYDVSRNGSRAWCSMQVCGNRNKARRYRRRATSAAD
jgi:predicted RNA-binding Zn ribbon-like protein